MVHMINDIKGKTIKIKMKLRKWLMVSTLPHDRTPQAPISSGPEHAINQAGKEGHI